MASDFPVAPAAKDRVTSSSAIGDVFPTPSKPVTAVSAVNVLLPVNV